MPGVGWMAYCKDTEGNTFGLMQPDPNVKQGRAKAEQIIKAAPGSFV